MFVDAVAEGWMVMEWQKLYSGLLLNPKYLGLSASSKALWLDCLLWIGNQETAGDIPRRVVACYDTSQEFAPAELISAGLWEAVEDGYRFHDYGEWQPDAERRKELNRTRQQRFRERGNALVTHNKRSVTQPDIDIEKKKISVPKGTESVFAAWVESTGSKAKLDDKRRGVIQRALKSHGEADCLDAVRGWVNDPWPDRPQHKGIEILLRDAAHIEKFRDLWRNGKPEPKLWTPIQDAIRDGGTW